jgi:hypothetical protein
MPIARLVTNDVDLDGSADNTEPGRRLKEPSTARSVQTRHPTILTNQQAISTQGTQ